MAIDLNTKTYGEQFNAFVNFASKNRNLGNVARIGETRAGTDLLGKNGEPRTIVAKDWDGSGQFWCFSSSRKVNNEVRDLFLKTILSVCSVDKIEELPQKVQDVLKAEDFNGKGRPLTARRIMAVKAAVDEIFDRVPPALNQAKASSRTSCVAPTCALAAPRRTSPTRNSRPSATALS